MSRTATTHEIRRPGAQLKLALLAGAMMAYGGGAYAQTAATAHDNTAATQIEEVIVTAQKRSENLQEVPISVTAVTSQTIEKFHASDMQTLNQVVPNLQVKASPNGLLSARYTLRGIGNAETDPFAGVTVGIVIDGVVLGASSISLVNMFDVERIEVLRGPQGTLFGASTTGGVINVITKQPTGEFGGEGVVTFGNHGRMNAALAVNVPIIEDVLAGKISVSHLGRDGFYRDFVTNETIDNQNETFLRGYLLYTPSPDLRVTLKGEYDRVRDGMAPVVPLTGPGELAYIPGLRNGIDFKSSMGGGENANNADQRMLTLTADWNSPIGQVTSITGYLDFNFHRQQDYDGTPVFFLHGPRNVKHWQVSQEVRDTFHPLPNVEMMVGGYAMTQNYKILQISLLQGVTPGLNSTSTQDFDNRMLAGFGQAYWDLTDKLRLQAGIRYTWEETKAFDDVANYLHPSRVAQLTGAPLISYLSAGAKESWGEFSGKVGLDYQVTEDILAYGYAAHGFKSGGFNGRISQPADIGPFGPEKVNTFEVGFKSDLLERRLRLNLAAFYNDYNDVQVPQVRFVGASATSTIQNAASAATYGVELETTVAPTRGLTLTGSLAYLEAEYDKFRIGTTCPAGPITTIPAGCSVYDNNQMPHAPKWSWTLGANYAFDMAGGETVASVLYNHTGRSWSAYTHYPVENLVATDLVNANLSWSPANNNWTVALWARNLTNEKYVTTARKVVPLFSDGQYGAPREYGVDFTARF